MFTIHQLLIFAARGGNLEVMRERLSAGADVSYVDEYHGSALFAAIVGRHVTAAEFLIANGADLQVTDAHGQGPLEYSLRYGNDDITAALLRAKARLQPHALSRFRELLSEHFRRRGIQHELPTA